MDVIPMPQCGQVDEVDEENGDRLRFGNEWPSPLLFVWRHVARATAFNLSDCGNSSVLVLVP